LNLYTKFDNQKRNGSAIVDCRHKPKN